jgi:hypothetical protein
LKRKVEERWEKQRREVKGDEERSHGRERRKEGEDDIQSAKFLIPQWLLTTIQNYA